MVNTPRVATQSGLTGRRTKVTTRRASSLRGLSPLIDESIKKEGNNVEDRIENSSSPETLPKMTQNKRQVSEIHGTILVGIRKELFYARRYHSYFCFAII